MLQIWPADTAASTDAPRIDRLRTQLAGWVRTYLDLAEKLEPIHNVLVPLLRLELAIKEGTRTPLHDSELQAALDDVDAGKTKWYRDRNMESYYTTKELRTKLLGDDNGGSGDAGDASKAEL